MGTSLRDGALSAVLVLLLSGCFSYARVPLDPMPVGSDVRLLVTQEGAAQLLSVVPTQGDSPLVEGLITGEEGPTILVRVPVATHPEMLAGPSELGQMVRVPKSEILSIELRRFSPVRTAALVGMAAVFSASVIKVIMNVRRQRITF